VGKNDKRTKVGEETQRGGGGKAGGGGRLLRPKNKKNGGAKKKSTKDPKIGGWLKWRNAKLLIKTERTTN